MSAIGAVLRESLLGLDLNGLSKKQVKMDITTAVTRVLADSGLGTVYRGMSTGARLQPPSSAAARLGYVDFAVVRDDAVALAIQIDRTDKRFSLTKLQHFSDGGATAIWVRWGEPTRLPIPGGVEIVQIPVPSMSPRRSPAEASKPTGSHAQREQTDIPITVWLSTPLWARDIVTGELVKSERHTARACRTRVTGGITAFLDRQDAAVMEFATDAIIETAWTAPPGTELTYRIEGQAPTWSSEPATRTVPATLQWILNTYPRAYQWWTDEEDVALLAGRRSGATIPDLATSHQRQPSAIKSRLRKLGHAEAGDVIDERSRVADRATATEVERPARATAVAVDSATLDGIPPAERLAAALYESERAWVDQDWDRLSSRSLSVLLLAHHDTVPDDSIVLAGRWYLGALMGNGELLNPAAVSAREGTTHLIGELAAWVRSRPHLSPLLSEFVAAASEIVTMAEEDSIMARGQVASRLRKVMRPDLAIVVADDILGRSRLNYYAMATRGAALCDLARYDEAIEALKPSLAPFRPAEGVGRVLNALSRAFRLRFLNEGDLDDSEIALTCAQAAWELSPDRYAANTYLAAAAASADPGALALAQDATQQIPTSTPSGDRSAFERAIARLGLR